MDEVTKRSISLPTDLAARIDEARGDVPFSRWMARAAETRLGGAPLPGGVIAVSPQVPGSHTAKANVKPRPKGGKR